MGTRSSPDRFAGNGDAQRREDAGGGKAQQEPQPTPATTGDPCVIRIHQTTSESDTDMEEEQTPLGSSKRPTDVSDDLRKAIQEARKVLPDLPVMSSLKRAGQTAQWTKTLKTA